MNESEERECVEYLDIVFSQVYTSLSVQLKMIWLDKLKKYSLEIVKRGFEVWLSDERRCGFTPKPGQIEGIIKSFGVAQSYEIQNCSEYGCQESGEQKFTPSVFLCKKHAEGYYLKNEYYCGRYEIAAKQIRLTQKAIEEAKAKGMTNLEYFKFCNPPGKSFFADVGLKNFRAEKSPAETSATLDKKIEQDRIIASHHENMVRAVEKWVNFDEIDFKGYEEMFNA
jgi:hypothetical protein